MTVLSRTFWGTLVSTWAAVSALGAEPVATTPDTMKILKGVESRYNKAITLRVVYSESYTFQNRRRPVESGVLTLRKPGKMRWEYTQPAGKLFVSDGKDAYYYNPDANRVERIRMKEVEDFRAPLAFLLGRLEFARDFKEYHVRPEGANFHIRCIPKNNRLPYTEVVMVVAPDSRIERLRVTGHDRSVLEFVFQSELVNPPTPDSQFYFLIPKGAEYVESSKETP